jgi:hypothetical protein
MYREAAEQSRSRGHCVSRVETSFMPNAKRFVNRIDVVETTPCAERSWAEHSQNETLHLRFGCCVNGAFGK